MGHKNAIVGTKEDRPWGNWEIISVGETVVKKITVNAGQMLSLQRHLLRAETWVPFETGLLAYQISLNGPVVELMEKGQMYPILYGTVHRLINPTDRDISLIEIIEGSYDEEDIIRLNDTYGRV